MRSIVSRGIFLLLSVWFIISVAFFCVYALPGDPARMILGHQASEQSIHEFRERAGLDQPLNHQYLLFLERTARLNWGNSVLYRRPVLQLIGERSRTTLTLVGCATVVLFLMAF